MIRNLQLETAFKKLCAKIVGKVEKEIKKSILLTKKMSVDDFWFGEKTVVNNILITKLMINFMDFEEYFFDPGAPYTQTLQRLYYSKRYNFYYYERDVYNDDDLVESLLNDDLFDLYLPTGEKNEKGFELYEHQYIEKPTIVTCRSFDKPEFYNAPSVKIEYGFYQILETFCDIDTSEIRKIFLKCKNDIDGLSRSASYYAKQDDYFKINLFHKVFSNAESKFNKHELALVYSYILISDCSDSIIRMLLTYNYTCDLYEKYPNDYIDLTFITVSLYKLVEILMCSFVNSLFNGIVIVDKYKNTIVLSDDDLTLGEMNQLFYCDNNTIKTFLHKSKPYSDQLKNILSNWIKYSRNGFLHKDSITEGDKLKQSSLKSLDVFFYLVLTFFQIDDLYEG